MIKYALMLSLIVSISLSAMNKANGLSKQQIDRLAAANSAKERAFHNKYKRGEWLTDPEVKKELDTISREKNALQGEILEAAGRNLHDDGDELPRAKKRKEEFDEDDKRFIALATKVYVEKEEFWQKKIDALVAFKAKLATDSSSDKKGKSSSGDQDDVDTQLKNIRHNLQVAQFDTKQARDEAIRQVRALK
jgi:hypothetical protein